MDVKEHGKITDEYIDYCRRDVQATAELAQILLKEFDRHPIQLQETKALSPASIGKAYLRAMRISPVLDRQSSLHPFVGYAQSAFFGGRTSVHIRKAPIPVVYTDFLSMYPTVNSLMNLWQFVIAKEIRFRPNCKEEITSLLKGIHVDELFRQETWKHLTAFVRVVPNGDVLPSRSRYSPETNGFNRSIPTTRPPSQDQFLRLKKTIEILKLEISGNSGATQFLQNAMRSFFGIKKEHQSFLETIRTIKKTAGPSTVLAIY